MTWLKNKKNQILLFLFSSFISIFTYNLNLYDYSNFLNSIRDSLFVVFVSVSFFSFIFIFVKFNVWKEWVKASILLSVFGFFIIFIASPEPEFLLTQRVLLAFVYWILYSLISLGIIIYHSLKK
jgi:hypothetical protein